MKRTFGVVAAILLVLAAPTLAQTGSGAGSSSSQSGTGNTTTPPESTTGTTMGMSPSTATTGASTTAMTPTGDRMCGTIRAEGERCSCRKAPRTYGIAMASPTGGKNACMANS